MGFGLAVWFDAALLQHLSDLSGSSVPDPGVTIGAVPASAESEPASYVRCGTGMKFNRCNFNDGPAQMKRGRLSRRLRK